MLLQHDLEKEFINKLRSLGGLKDIHRMAIHRANDPKFFKKITDLIEKGSGVNEKRIGSLRQIKSGVEVPATETFSRFGFFNDRYFESSDKVMNDYDEYGKYRESISMNVKNSPAIKLAVYEVLEATPKEDVLIQAKEVGIYCTVDLAQTAGVCKIHIDDRRIFEDYIPTYFLIQGINGRLYEIEIKVREMQKRLSAHNRGFHEADSYYAGEQIIFLDKTF